MAPSRVLRQHFQTMSNIVLLNKVGNNFLDRKQTSEVLNEEIFFNEIYFLLLLFIHLYVFTGTNIENMQIFLYKLLEYVFLMHTNH